MNSKLLNVSIRRGRLTMLSSVVVSALWASSAMGQESWFKLDGKSYTDKQLSTDVRNAVFEARNEAHETVERHVKEYAVRLALAKEQNKNVDPAKLPPLQDLLKATPPTDAEMKQVFEDNKNRLPPGTTYEQVKDEIRGFVSSQKLAAALASKLAELEKSGRFSFSIAAPNAPAVDLQLSGQPARGPANAKVTLVEASDYLCPSCQNVHSEVEKVLKDHGSKLRFVQVNYALRPEGLSGTLARGAYCAQKQSDDMFWSYHNAAFAKAIKDKLTPSEPADRATATAIAKDAKVKDLAAWETCLDSDEAKTHITKTAEAMAAAGVSGTPTFFLNNRKLHVHQGELGPRVAAALK